MNKTKFWTLTFIASLVIALTIKDYLDKPVRVRVTYTPPTTAPAVPIPSTTAPMTDKFLSFSDNVPPRVERKVREAVTYGQGLNMVTSCPSIEVSVDPSMREPKNGLTTWYPSGLYPCTIEFRPGVLDGTWDESYTIYHEVAHIFTTHEIEGHGPEFRRVEALLYQDIDLEVFYVTNDTYPNCFRLDKSRINTWCEADWMFDRLP